MQPFSGWPELAQKPVAVLGYGVEGKSTLHHLIRHGARDLVVLDRSAPPEALPEGVRGVFGPDYLKGLDGVAVAFRAPGVRPLVPEIRGFVARGGRLTSQVEAAIAVAGRARVVGVTGTVGKGTCCSLLSAMLGAAGVPHALAGNIGTPPLDALETLPPGALLVLELSSFQLSTLRESPATAVVLRTTTEHLDWHATRDEYWDHKANLVRFQGTADVCIFFEDAEGSHWMGSLGAGRKVSVGRSGDVRILEDAVEWPGRGLRLAFADTRLAGAFNLENLGAAAAAAIELGAPPEAVAEGARNFTPLEHRLELVREKGGVRYYNDSYATRPEAALAAVRAFRESDLGLILGGSEKYADFSKMAVAMSGEPQLRAIAFIGQTAERLEEEFRAAGGLDSRAWKRCATLEEALAFLRGEIRAGVILLSPACASFGLFANYKERGKAFKKLVAAP